jgi:multiple antibiotic resistance protein
MDRLLNDFILLFTVIDPVGSVPVFIAVSSRVPREMRNRIAWRAIGVATAVLIFFLVAGQFLLEAMKIPLPALKAAGGIILFLFALDMLFGMSKPESEVREVEEAAIKKARDLAIYPLAIPSIAGPGAIMAVIVLTDRHRFSFQEQTGTAIMMLLVLLIVFVCMLLANRIQRLIGDAGASIISRVMGLIMAALAASYIFEGISEYFGLTTSVS